MDKCVTIRSLQLHLLEISAKYSQNIYWYFNITLDSFLMFYVKGNCKLAGLFLDNLVETLTMLLLCETIV